MNRKIIYPPEFFDREETTMTTTRGEWITQPAIYAFHGIMADHRTQIRAYYIGAVGPYAQYDQAVSIGYKLPRKRDAEFHTVTPNGTSYVEILTLDGTVLYDSRDDIPLDMDDWQAHRRPSAINTI